MSDRLQNAPAASDPEPAERRAGNEESARETALVRARYDRGAWRYDLQAFPLELAMMDRFRRRLISQVSGPRVLEVGVGTGRNLAYYAPDLQVDAIDFSPRMLARARRRPQRSGVQLHEMDVQRMQFADGTFDTVVSTCVFCSVPDPVLGLEEIRRLLRPRGRGLFLEHVRPGHPWLGALFDWLDPIVSKAGPHVNRRTVDNVRAAGLTIEGEENLLWDIVKLIVARP